MKVDTSNWPKHMKTAYERGLNKLQTKYLFGDERDKIQAELARIHTAVKRGFGRRGKKKPS